MAAPMLATEVRVGAIVYKNLRRFVRVLGDPLDKILVPAKVARASSGRGFVGLR